MNGIEEQSIQHAGVPIEQRWTAGLATLVVMAGLLFLPLGGKARETALWITVGAALPAAALAARTLGRSQLFRLAQLERGFGLVALAAATVLAIALALHGRDATVPILGVVQVGLVLILVRRSVGPPRVVLLGALFGYAVAMPIVWWTAAPGVWLTRNVALTLLGLCLVVAKLCRAELSSRAPSRWIPIVGASAAFLLFGYASLNTDLVSSVVA